MHIGELAKRAGFAESQIRYWERRGLLPPPERKESGYRVYGQEDVRRLDLLRRGKALGLSLGEIGELLETAERGCCGEAAAAGRALASRKIAEIDRRIAELGALRATLVEALAADGPVPDGCLAEPCAESDGREGREVSELTVVRVPEKAAENPKNNPTSSGCCEPECGPETCGSEASVELGEEQAKAKVATGSGCCEPECGPETCG